MSRDYQTVFDQVPVTPSDTDDIKKGCIGIAVNASGNVKMTLASGRTVTRYLLAGVDYPHEITRIHATDTTATGIHALYF